MSNDLLDFKEGRGRKRGKKEVCIQSLFWPEENSDSDWILKRLERIVISRDLSDKLVVEMYALWQRSSG